MPACAFHLDRPALLNCGDCRRGLCGECVRHTELGWRCLSCMARDGIPELQPTERTQTRFLQGLGAGALGALLVPPLVIVGGLLFAVAEGFYLRLSERWRLLGGLAYFIIAWAVAVQTVVAKADVKSFGDIDVSLPGAMFVLVLMAALVPLLWRPARKIAQALILRGRGYASGMTLASAAAAVGVSVLSGVFFLFGAF